MGMKVRVDTGKVKASYSNVKTVIIYRTIDEQDGAVEVVLPEKEADIYESMASIQLYLIHAARANPAIKNAIDAALAADPNTIREGKHPKENSAN